jgi:hypothetical protein
MDPGSPIREPPVLLPNESPNPLIREVDTLKEDMRNLMERIRGTLKSPHFSPKVVSLIDRKSTRLNSSHS